MKVSILDIGIRDRFRRDLGDVEALAKDLRETGQITPVTIRATSDDDREAGFTESFMLMAGGRRMHAAITNGWDEIEAYMKDELPPMERLIVELHENLFRKDMTWAEQVTITAEIHRLRKIQNPDHEKYKTAIELKKSTATITRDIALAEELEKNPGLAKAGSRKAAIRAVEFTKHTDAMMAQSDKAFTRGIALKASIVTADARDFLKLLEPQSVDLLYSDPLWGIDYFSQGHKAVREGDESFSTSEYDDSEEAMQDVMIDCIPKMIKAVKPTGWMALHCGYDAYNTWREYIESYCLTHDCYTTEDQDSADYASSPCRAGGCKHLTPEPLPWIWHRPNSQNRSRYSDLHEDNRFEYILIVNMGEAKLYRQHQGNVLTHDAEYGQRIHAMQKPLTLCQDVVSRLTLPRMTVVDPFFGSGALLAGAASLQRPVKGCDLNPDLLGPALGYISSVSDL